MNVQRMPIVLLLLLLAACSKSAATPPAAPVSPAVSDSPELVQPATAALTKSIGTPVPGWEDIPIMPGAYDPELAEIVYLY